MVRHKRFPLVRSTALLVALVLAGYVALAARLDIPAVQAQRLNYRSPQNSSVTTSLDWPAVGQAAIGALDFGVLETHGAQTATPTASTAKIMTALAVLKVKPLKTGQTTTPLITITEADAALYHTYVAKQGSVVPVNVGERLSEYQALQALLLPSANNMADTLVHWAFGSMDAYTEYANKLADELGLTSTHFADASGFSPRTVSSAHDLVLLAEAALQHPVISKIIAQKSAKLPIAGTVRNTNWLLGTDGINGVKTGNTDQAGGCYIFAAKQVVNGRTITVIGAVMASRNLTQAMRDGLALLKSSHKHFVSQTVITKGTAVAAYQSPGHQPVAATAASDLSVITWNGVPARTKLTTIPLHVPAKSGAVVGHYSVTDPANGKQVSVSIKLAQPLPAPSWWWRLTHVL